MIVLGLFLIIAAGAAYLEWRRFTAEPEDDSRYQIEEED